MNEIIPWCLCCNFCKIYQSLFNIFSDVSVTRCDTFMGKDKVKLIFKLCNFEGKNGGKSPEGKLYLEEWRWNFED